jgi:aspartate racemase
MIKRRTGGILGVVGGMGPLASSEFVKTIYEYSLKEREQDSPVVFLYSDPTFPDRTEELLAGNGNALLEQLIIALRRVRETGASKVVICCVTLHHLLPALPDDLRSSIISLVDVILDGVVKSRQRHLLLCTTGARELGLFQAHARWRQAEDYIILLDESDQRLIHSGIIYQIKKNRDLRELIPLLHQLLSKYGSNSFIAGCTELHLLVKHLAASEGDFGCVDPLDMIAREVATGHL